MYLPSFSLPSWLTASKQFELPRESLAARPKQVLQVLRNNGPL